MTIELSRLGWSYGDTQHWRGHRAIWMVNADTQSEAWDEALRQAGSVQRSA